MTDKPAAPRNPFTGIAPALADYTERVLFGDVWERKALSKRDRSLITIASLITQASTEQLRGHLWRALDNGVTREEITEVVTHLAFYVGWPNAGSAALMVKQVFEERPA